MRRCAGIMRYSTLIAIFAGAALGGASCGGKSLAPAPDAGTPDAGVSSDDAGTSGRDAGRVPKEHRASRTACPAERGAVTPTSDGCPIDVEHGRCAQDSDCSAGRNGRCWDVGSCPSDCSYDDCFQDSDCARQTPCGCRLSATDNNYCYTASNCSVDADCGNGGYCSPSKIGRGCSCDNCGEGYFCHTDRDSCLDDSDCPFNEPCAFNVIELRFSCQSCLPHL